MRFIQSRRWWCAAALAGTALALPAQAQLFDNGADRQTDVLSATATLRPRLVMESEVRDLGHILQVERPEFDFTFTNVGPGPLVISRVQSTCGCTVPELTKKEYKAGESGAIHVKFDPAGKIGAVHKQIHVYSNDPDRPDVSLSLKADVSPVVTVEPRALTFEPTAKGEGRTVVLKITGRTDDFAATYATVAKGENFSVKVLDTKAVQVNGQAMRQTEVEVTLAPAAPVGRLTDNVSIRTTDPREAVVFCPITATVVGDLKLDPTVLPFGIVRPGEAFKGTVQIASRSNKPFKILKAEIKQPSTAQLQIKLVPEDPANPVVYTLWAEGTSPTLAEGVRPVPVQGYIVVTTDVDREGTIEIPFFIQPRLGPTAPQTPGAVPQRPTPAPVPAPIRAPAPK